MRSIVPAALSILILSSCGLGDDCTSIRAVPVVNVDVEPLAERYDLTTLVVCLDRACVVPGRGDDPLVFAEEDQARFAGDDEDPFRTIEVRTESGEVIVAPTAVELTVVRPNGPKCGGEALQGWFRVTEDQELIAVTPTGV